MRSPWSEAGGVGTLGTGGGGASCGSREHGSSKDKSFPSLTHALALSTQDSPTNKLLYAKEIPEYRKVVQRYYKQIHDMTPLSEQEMNAHLAEESRVRWGCGGSGT